ncbi:MAG TPA: arsenite methyltransferase [Bacteroidales bacterium]|nr:arsenite methyltransferase [Bacteroidales bacterium]
MEDKKKIVQEKYANIAGQSKEFNAGSCCGATGCCGDGSYTIFSEDYSNLDGYNPDADMNLGCGIPTDFANIKPGDTVIDLGSGAGNDCFVARAMVGDSGQVIGIDFTKKMIEKAMTNADKLNFKNVQFRFGDIENMPVTANKADVVISNCVINLVPDKAKAFAEIYRVLKSGGHFCISDVVLRGDLPQSIKEAAAMYAGCVAGALQIDEYLEIIAKNGFTNLKVQKEKPIIIPDEILGMYLDSDGIKDFKSSGTGIFSITVYAEKPKTCCCGCDC